MRLETLVITDDFDGTPDATEVSFAIDGQVYTIDLSAEHDAELHQALARFVTAGTRTGRLRAHRRATKRPNHTSRHAVKGNADIREWAKRTGMRVAARGRLPDAVVTAYVQAQAQPRTRIDHLAEERRAAAPVGEHLAGHQVAQPVAA